jgi:hypothetical protein
MLKVESISLPQSSLMLLEGEKATFQVKIKNTSPSSAAEFLRVSFTDSTTAAMQEALTNKNLSSADLFDLEYQIKHRPAISLMGKPPATIEAGGICELGFEILGKPGLTNTTILLDYATAPESQTANDGTFNTRQITIPLAVTVNASVQLQRLDVLPISELATTEGLRSENGNCLLLLDMRNVWPSPLEINVELLDQSRPQKGTASFFKSQEIVQPGHVARMVLLIPKIHIKNPHARIRSANERQFVVSSNTLSPDAERSSRELFWYREELAQRLRATWKQKGDSKSGSIDLRGVLRLTPRMIDILKVEDLEITMEIEGAAMSKGKAAQDTGFSVTVGDFAILKTTMRNQSSSTIRPLLRLQPSLAHQSVDTALDLGRRLSWSGTLQSVVKPMAAGETAVAKLVLCALCSGEYEVSAIVEEVKRAPLSTNGTDEHAIPDPVADTAGRRSWVASSPCRIFATE